VKLIAHLPLVPRPRMHGTSFPYKTTPSCGGA